MYYTRKNIRQQYKNNKLKMLAPAWNDEFELPDSCYLRKILTTNSSIYICINRINDTLLFKIKDGNKLENVKIIDKTKNRENVPCLDVVEVVLV